MESSRFGCQSGEWIPEGSFSIVTHQFLRRSRMRLMRRHAGTGCALHAQGRLIVSSAAIPLLRRDISLKRRTRFSHPPNCYRASRKPSSVYVTIYLDCLLPNSSGGLRAGRAARVSASAPRQARDLDPLSSEFAPAGHFIKKADAFFASAKLLSSKP